MIRFAVGLHEQIDRFIGSRLNVILEGESGVGKGYFARKIHQTRNRGGKLAVYDCEGTVQDQKRIVEQLTSPDFFAKSWRLKDGNTFFIRRIDRLSEHLLARFSDFLDEVEKRGVISRKELLTSGIIGSVNKIEISGSLKQQLLYKFLNNLFCFKIVIPPLRERKEEIPLFVKRFICVLNTELERKVTGISQEALEVLLQYHWPNNLCELRSEIERAITLTKDHESIKSASLSGNLLTSVTRVRSLVKK